MSHNVHKFTLDVTYVQKGVQLVTKVCYNLEFSYIYKQLIINKKALCLIAEGCTSGVHITNCLSVIYAVLFSYFDLRVEIFAKIFYLETMRIVDDIEQQIQKSEFLAILIQAMKSIGESRMTDHHRTAINSQMPCQSIL